MLQAVVDSVTQNVLIQVAGAAVGAAVLVQILIVCTSRSKCKQKIQIKQQERSRVFDAVRSTIAQIKDKPDRLKYIESLSAQEIIDLVKDKKLTATEVLQCYQHKALQSHDKINCLVEPIPGAQEVAESCLSTEGPLCGLPVSLKENFGLKGLDCTAGCPNALNKPVPEDCVLVQVLRHQGAVPFVRTNVPQVTFSWETSNPIYGLTINPLSTEKPRRNVGGSSGGEAALLAGNGSLLGFGNDIGGSLRIPAAMCGICSLKPTAGRISGKGVHPLFGGQTVALVSQGPMAQDVDTLALAMKAVLVPYMWQLDPNVPPLPFKTEVYESRAPLTIGYYVDDGQFPSVPAMKRAVYLAKQLLQNQGHKLVEWKFTRNYGREGELLWGKSVFGDGGKEIQDHLHGDPVDKLALGDLPTLISVPNLIKSLLVRILSCFSNMEPLALSLDVMRGSKNVAEWWKVHKENQELQAAVLKEWRANGFDAVICPGFACTAVPVGVPAECGGANSYNALYNQLNYPAGSLPVTTVTQDDEACMVDYPDSNPWFKAIKNGMVGSTGLPVNLQVVTLPYQEELCLRVMKELETAVRQNNKK